MSETVAENSWRVTRFCPPHEELGRYAKLVAEAGATVVESQPLYVFADIYHAPFVRELTTAAYERGAANVEAIYSDQFQRKAHIAAAPMANLSFTPAWMVQRMNSLGDGASVVWVTGQPDPKAFEDLPVERVSKSPRGDEIRAFRDAVDAGNVRWALVAYPTAGWANLVYGEADPRRLWDAIAHMTRIRDDDPVAAWRERMEILAARARQVEAAGFDSVVFRGPGTDLTVGLLPDARWLCVHDRTQDGVDFLCNIPSEEIYTSSDPNRVDGRVRATAPLVISGTVIRDLALTFEGGAIVAVSAAYGREIVEAELERDPGARRLGEVALVDKDGRVGQTNTLYYSTLFDENATSHIAYGSGFTHVYPGVTAAEAYARGVNDSGVHTDLMIGSDAVAAIGVKKGSGTEVPIIVNGRWVLSS